MIAELLGLAQETLLKLRRRIPGSVKNTHNLQWLRVR
jgi:hypothetical protein